MEGNSFRYFKEQFAALDPPEALEGVRQGEPVGPGWYRTLAGPSLAIGWLPHLAFPFALHARKNIEGLG